MITPKETGLVCSLRTARRSPWALVHATFRAGVACAILGTSLAAAAPRQRAFPGAEGFGAYARGGRGGKVIFVTNTNDSGPGSLREAVDTAGPRTVVFRVSGTIELKSALRIKQPFLTIAGQTAPGDGICLKGREVVVDAHDCIIRYIRFRLGDGNKTADDALATYRDAQDSIIDHCSASWAVDETISATFVKNVTIQWCIISESLNNSSHPKGEHGYGSLINGEEVTYHHNLYAHHSNRVPRPAACLLDFRNNVLYDFGGGGYNHGEATRLNYVGNYIIPQDGRKEVSFTVKKPSGSATLSKIYLARNLNTASAAATADNRRLLQVDPGAGTVQDIVVADPAFAVPAEYAVTTQDPKAAYDVILAGAGAILPKRDAIDSRIVQEVRNRTGKIINSQSDVGGYPTYNSGQPPADADNDGMPDEWEQQHGLNPADPADGARLAATGYSQLEEYLNRQDGGTR